MKILAILNAKAGRFASVSFNLAYEVYADLTIAEELKLDIKQRVYSEKDFEVNAVELQKILPCLDEKIEKLLMHPDFNPLKEELRQRFPEQYDNEPFEYKGHTYYLHSKTFAIDSQIYRIAEFKELVIEHILANEPLKYRFINN
jgi:hypothetical protein